MNPTETSLKKPFDFEPPAPRFLVLLVCLLLGVMTYYFFDYVPPLERTSLRFVVFVIPVVAFGGFASLAYRAVWMPLQGVSSNAQVARRAMGRRVLGWGLPVALIGSTALEIAKLHLEAKPPDFAIHSDAVLSSDLGLKIPLTPGWRANTETPGYVFFNAANNGAVLMIMARSGRQLNDADAALDQAIAERRKDWGNERDVIRGDRKLGFLSARTITFTQDSPRGPFRSEIAYAQKGAYWVGFFCGGAESTFASTAQACHALLEPMEAL